MRLSPLLIALALFPMLTGSARAGTLPQVEVTTCGQVVPDRTLGYLSADLDCTGFTGGPVNAVYQGAAVYLGKKSQLDLRGFTVTGGRSGVLCDALTCDGRPCSQGPCEVFNGTVTGATSGDTGVRGYVPRVHDLTISGFNFGIVAVTRATLTNVTVTGAAENGVEGYGAQHGFRTLTMDGSTVTGSGRFGVAVFSNLGMALLKSSTISGNGGPTFCNAGPGECGDIFTYRRPRLVDTTCDTSVALSGGNWGVCSLD